MYQPGERIDRYEVVRALGAGSMGMVYEAKDGSRPVAVKVLAQDQAVAQPTQHEEDIRRMQREVSALLPLEHPNIVRVFAFGWTVEHLPYYVMEHIDGESLGKWMQRAPELKDVLCVFRKLAQALGEMHRLGLIHRDLKPSNVLVRGDGEPVLIDFGVVQSETAPTLTRTGGVVGNFLYAAPELAACVLDEGKHGEPVPYTPAYDVHALGLMLYQALAGRYPFELPEEDRLGLAALYALHKQVPLHLSEVAPHVPRAVGDLVMWMLHKNPARRPREGAEVARRLESLEEGRAPRLTLPRWARRFGLGALAAAGLAAAALSMNSHAPAPPGQRASSPPRVDAPAPAPQPVRPMDSSVLTEKGASPVPPSTKAKPAAKPKAPGSTSARGALALCALALSGCAGAELRPDGLPAVCPQPSRTLKPLNIPAGFEFRVTFPKEIGERMRFPKGPPRRGFSEPKLWPRFALEIQRPLEAEVWANQIPFPIPSFIDARIYGVVKPGPERTDIIFTRLKLKNGDEYPICAVAYTSGSVGSQARGKRGMPVPPTPPEPPPGHVFIDTGEFTAHVLQPF